MAKQRVSMEDRLRAILGQVAPHLDPDVEADFVVLGKDGTLLYRAPADEVAEVEQVEDTEGSSVEPDPAPVPDSEAQLDNVVELRPEPEPDPKPAAPTRSGRPKARTVAPRQPDNEASYDWEADLDAWVAGSD